MRVFLKRLSDDEYVEKQRRSLASLARNRWWIVLLYLVASAGHIWIAVRFSEILLDLWKEVELEDANAPYLLGLVAGGFVGFGLALSLTTCFASLVHAIRGGRSERLLVQYYRPSSGSESMSGGSTGL